MAPDSRQPRRRYLALWFAYLPTERLRSPCASGGPNDPPFVLAARERGALRLTAADAKAEGLGLGPGMGLAQARSRVAALRVGVADFAADARFLLRLAEACEMFTPRVALDGPDGLVLDVTGCSHLFGGEDAMAGQVRARLSRLGVSCRPALAATPQAARAFARFSAGGIVPSGAEAQAARPLPVRALEADEKTCEALVRAGLVTLGDLADRPSQLLSARFDAAVVTRLGRILGHEDPRIAPLRPRPDLGVEEHFAEPFTATDHLHAAVGRLAERLGELLARNGRGGRAFELSLFRSDGAVRRLTVETSAPTQAAASLVRLFRLRVEGLADPVDPGFGFDAVRLTATASDPFTPSQQSWEGRGADAGSSLGDLIDRLVARFGREHVLRFVASDTHDPRRAGRAVPWLAAASSDPWPAAEPGAPPRRPLTLFEPPQPIDALAEVPDGPPVRFRWRRVLHEVARAEGPERIAPDWWRRMGAEAPAARDHYRIEDRAGRRFWLCREGGYGDAGGVPKWYVLGLFA